MLLINSIRTHRPQLTVALAILVLATTSEVVFAQPGGGGRLPGDVELEKGPLAVDDFEKNALGVLADIAANQRFQNVPQHDGRLLRIIAQAVGAKQVVELGTSTGYSGIWFGLALKETGGKLTTYEIDSQRATAARENFERARMANIITLVEGDAHAEVTKLKGTIDLIFLDADKEGFLRSTRSLIQTCGRASRNAQGKVIMYADLVTHSMKLCIDETNRRRKIQQAYNRKHNITPETIQKVITQVFDFGDDQTDTTHDQVAETVAAYKSLDDIDAVISSLKKEMNQAANWSSRARQTTQSVCGEAFPSTSKSSSTWTPGAPDH